MQEEFLQLIYNPNQWTWFFLCFLLLILEALGAAGFLIGIALGCFITGGLVAVHGIFSTSETSWEAQILLVSVTSSIFTVVYWKFFRAAKQRSSKPELNNKMAQMVGRRFKIEGDIELDGTVRIGDTVWKVRSAEVLAGGSIVNVIDTEGSVLIVE